MTAVVSTDELQDSRWRAFTWICVLQILDLVTTFVAITMAGASEGNGISAWLIRTHLLVPAKLLVCGLILLGITKTKPSVSGLAMIWMVTGIYIMTIVVNTMHIWKAG